jgi:hypothetical protein
VSDTPRTLWMVLFEADGITGDVILEEAARLGYGGTGSKMGDLEREDLENLRRACFARVGLTDEDADERFRQTPVYREYMRRLREDPPQFQKRSRQGVRQRRERAPR